MKLFERLSIIGLIAGFYLSSVTRNMTLGIYTLMIILPLWFLLIIFYLIVAPFYFNTIAANAIFKKSTYTKISVRRMAGTYLACITIAFMLFSMFRISSHEGGRQWLLAGALVALVILVTATIQYLRKQDTFYLGIAIRMALLIAATYVVFAKMMHHMFF